MRKLHSVLVLVLAIAGCATPRTPPVLTAADVQPPAIPAPPPVDDASLFGLLKVRDPVELARRVGVSTTALTAALPGVDLRDLRPSGSLALFLWDPSGGGLDKLPVAGLLPATASSSLVRALSRLTAPGLIKPLGEDTLVAFNPTGFQRGASQALKLQSIAQAPTPADVQLYVNMAAVMARYGGSLEQSMNLVQKQMAGAGKQTEAAKQSSATMAKAMLDALNSIESVLVNLQWLPDSVLFSSVSRDKPGASAGVADPTTAVNQLVTFLSPGDIRFQAAGPHLKRWMDWSLKIYGPILANDPQTMAKVKAIFSEWAKDEHMRIAYSFSLSAERLFSGQTIILSQNAAKQMESLHQGLLLVNDSAIQETYRKLGLALSVTEQLGQRKIEGWPVDHYEVQATPVPGSQLASPEMATLRKLYPMAFEAVRMGDYLLIAMNGAPGDLETMARDLLSGHGRGKPLDAVRVFPEGGFLHGDFDIAGLLRGFKAFLPAKSTVSWPVLDPALPRVTFSAYDSGSATYYRTNVPRAVISAVVDAAKKASAK